MSDPSPTVAKNEGPPAVPRKPEQTPIPGSGALTAAFDSLVAAAGVDELIAARQKSGGSGSFQNGEPACVNPRTPSPPKPPAIGPSSKGTWRLTFGGGWTDLDAEMVLARSQTGSLAPAAHQSDGDEEPSRAKSIRLRVRNIRNASLHSAIQRRRIRDLEIGDDVTDPEGNLLSQKKEARFRQDTTVVKIARAPFNGAEDTRAKASSKKRMYANGDEDVVEAEIEAQMEYDDHQDDVDWHRRVRNGKGAKRQKGYTSRRPLRHYLQPVSMLGTETNGRRRRGRPPGSGNRRPMEPQRVGPDGSKRFNLRSAKYTGVYRTPANRWRAQFCHRGQVVQLGMYDNESSAARRWDMEALRLRGTKTPLNFPHLKPLYLQQLAEVDSFGKDDPDPNVVLYGAPPELDEQLLAKYEEQGPDSSKKMAIEGPEEEPSTPTAKNLVAHLQAQNMVIGQTVTPVTAFTPRNAGGPPSNFSARYPHLYSTSSASTALQMLETATMPIPLLTGRPFTDGQSPANTPAEGNLPNGSPGEKGLGKTGSSFSESLALAAENGRSPSSEPQGVKVVPESVLTHVKQMMESVVRAANKDMQGAQERLTRAMDVLVIGETMRREAQICIDVSRVRKEAAEKLLLKFDAVLEPIGSDDRRAE